MKTNTPDDIEKYSVDSVYKIASTAESFKGLPSTKARLNIIKMVFDILGYDLTPDLALALCSEPQSQLVISIAGGGKTTGAQIKAICEKIWRKSKLDPTKSIRGANILCLVYNKHNVKPMQDKHREMVSRLRLANIKGLDIDDTINASTMHSFCDQWRKEYIARLGLMKCTLLDESEGERLMKTVATKIFQQYGIDHDKLKSVSDIMSLHNLAKESLCSISDLEDTNKFVDVGLDAEVLEKISEMYEKMKKLKKKYDFTDMLVGVYKLLRDNPDILQRVQRYYDYIIADEVQDFTPIMMKILHILISDKTPLMCIGDDDQSIYKFRGADIYHTLHFSEEFSGGEVYLLSRNRRCRKAILDLAKKVIDENKLRYVKQMVGVKDAGTVTYLPYNSIESENINLFSQLKQLSSNELDDSVVCYRERISSIMITELLEECKIPFNVIGGYPALSHELYTHVIHVLNILESPLDPGVLLNLYKCTPLKKTQVYDALGFDASTGQFKGDRDKIHFAKLDFGNAMNIKGLDKDIEFLASISAKITKIPMMDYFDDLFAIIKKFFWNFQKQSRGLPEVYDNFVEEKIYKIFNSDKTYPEVFAQFMQRRNTVKINQEQKYGVTISTFHGLKGLEFSNVYIMDLDNDIFPNFGYIDRKNYDDKTKQLLKECETCLYYVAVTRAKDNLFLYFNESNPSRYVTLYNESLKSYSSDISENNMNYMRLFEEPAVSTEKSQATEEVEEGLIEDSIVIRAVPNSSIGVSNNDSYMGASTGFDIFDPFVDDEEEKTSSLQNSHIIESVCGSNCAVSISGKSQFGSYLNNLLDF